MSQNKPQFLKTLTLNTPLRESFIAYLDGEIAAAREGLTTLAIGALTDSTLKERALLQAGRLDALDELRARADSLRVVIK